MHRRLSAVIAACAVAAAALANSVPAHGAVSSVTLLPSSWALGSSPEATVTMALGSVTTDPFVIVDWDWGTSGWPAPNTTNETATANVAGDTYTCASGISFRVVDATWAGTPNCDYAAAGPNTSVSRKVTLDDVTAALTGTGSPRIIVTFPAGMVIAQASSTMVGVWTVNDNRQARATVTTSSGDPLPLITINIDGNGGRCNTGSVTGIQGTWATAPPAGDCSRAGTRFVGFNTAANGSGIAIPPGGNLNLTADNTLYAQYITPRVSSAPTDVVATPGLKKVTVTWKAPSDPGTGPINGYRVQAYPGFSTCVTNLASANMLECTFTNLALGTKYTFAVQALNQAGWSSYSSGSNLTSPYDLLLDSLSRPEVKVLFIKRGSNLEAAGRAPGLEPGTVLTPVLQVGADGAFVPQAGNTTKVNADGDFTWSRKLDRNTNNKPASLYFTYADAKTATLTAGLGARVGLPTAPRDVKVKSDTAGFTVSWQPPASDGGSPITEYVMTSDVRAPSWAQSRFVSCTVKAPTTTCTMPGSSSVFDPKKEYTFSVVAKTERGTSRQASKTWKGELYRLNIFKRARVDSEVLLSFSAVGWPKDARGFEIQAKVGENGPWKKQGMASLDPDYVEPIGDWIGMLPKSVTAGSEVFYRVKSDKGFSNVVRFRLSSSFEYTFG
jgi:hypothetical protein